MNVPAKPLPSPVVPSAGDGEAAGSLADKVATAGLKLQAESATKPDPDQKWSAMGGELYDAIASKDRTAFARLFGKQVKIAVAEALRGNKR